MPEIRQLDQSTIDRIAAGEVVERPAAALKELVENSLDAGATRVDVELESGGIDLVRVADDGHGMTAEAVERAIEKHTTSKIERLSDLEHVGTLGFRGEALHAIAAVSTTTITTRAAEAARGTALTIEGGEVVERSPAGRPVGTTVAVSDLFYNVPARQKYLSQPSTEFAHCNRVVSRYALANPDVAVSLTHDGREVFATPGRGDLREAALAVYGREVAESLVPVEATAEPTAEAAGGGDDPLADAPLTRVHGYVSDPETTRSTREYLATYVNGRYVEEATLRDAVLSAYGGQLAADRFPFAVLFVECPPGAVDANVHPRKLEVRFSDRAAVSDAVEAAVRDGLLEAGIVRQGAPRGKSAPGDATVAPETLDDGEDVDGGTGDDVGTDDDVGTGPGPGDGVATGSGDEAGTATPASASDTASRAAETASRPADTAWRPADDADATPSVSGGGQGPDDGGTTPNVSGGGVDEGGGKHDRSGPRDADDADPGSAAPRAPDETEGMVGSSGSTDGPSGTADIAETAGTPTTADSGATTGDCPTARDPPPSTEERSRRFRPATQNATLPGAADTWSGGAGADDTAVDDAGDVDAAGRPATEFDSLPSMTVLGQLDETYVVAATEDGLMLLDQHAADERIHYERLAAAAAEESASQRLVDPVTLSLTAGEAAVFEAALGELRELGFEARLEHGGADGDASDGEAAGDTGAPRAVVEAVPAVLADPLSPELLRDALAEYLADEAGDGSEAIAAAADGLLADLSCRPAVTGNTRLGEGSVVALLEALDDCENPYACPHGRPTIVSITAAEIADRFERDYPGHQVRRPEGDG